MTGTQYIPEEGETVTVGGSYEATVEAVDEGAGVAVVSFAAGPVAASGLREADLADVEPAE